MGTRAGPSFSKGLGPDDFISKLILSNRWHVWSRK